MKSQIIGLIAIVFVLVGCAAQETPQQKSAKNAYSEIKVPALGGFCLPHSEEERQELIDKASAQNPSSVILSVQRPCGETSDDKLTSFLAVVASVKSAEHREPREETIARAAFNTRFVDMKNLDRFFDNPETRKEIADIQFGGSDAHASYLLTIFKPKEQVGQTAHVMAFTNLKERPLMVLIRQQLAPADSGQAILNRAKLIAAALVANNK